MIWDEDDYETVNVTLFCGSEPSGGAVAAASFQGEVVEQMTNSTMVDVLSRKPDDWIITENRVSQVMEEITRTVSRPTATKPSKYASLETKLSALDAALARNGYGADLFEAAGPKVVREQVVSKTHRWNVVNATVPDGAVIHGIVSLSGSGLLERAGFVLYADCTAQVVKIVLNANRGQAIEVARGRFNIILQEELDRDTSLDMCFNVSKAHSLITFFEEEENGGWKDISSLVNPKKCDTVSGEIKIRDYRPERNLDL